METLGFGRPEQIVQRLVFLFQMLFTDLLRWLRNQFGAIIIIFPTRQPQCLKIQTLSIMLTWIK